MAEKRTIELEIQDNSKTLKQQYKEAVVELQKVAAAYGETSTQAAEAAKKAAGLKDQIEDTNDLLQSYKGEGAFIAMGKAMSSVASGFSAVEGGLGLIGVESEKLQETMLKVQSAMALAQGLEGLEDAGRAFKNLGAKAMQYSAVQKVVTAGQWLWNAAMNANPLGAVVVAITALIAAGYALIKYFKSQAAETERATQSIKNHNKALDKQNEALKNSATRLEKANKFQEDYAKASGASAEELRKLAIKHAEEELALANKNKELAKSTYLREQDILMSMRANGADEEVIKKQSELVKKAGESAKEMREIAVKEKNELVDLKKQQRVEIKQEQTREIKDKKDAAKSSYDAQKEAIQNELKQIEEFNKQAKEQNAARLRSDQENEEYAITEKYKEQIALFQKHKKDTSQLEIAQANEINEVRLKYQEIDYKQKEEARQKELDAIKEANEKRIALEDQQFELQQSLNQTQKEKEIADLVKSYEDKFAIANGNAELEKQLTEQQKIDLGLIEDKYRKEKETKDKEAAEKEIQAALAVQQQKAAIQQQGLDTALQGVQLIASLFEKQKGVQKAAVIAESAIGIAKMIIANKLANAGALATPQAIATSGAAAAPVIAMNNISTGIGIAANIAATAKALKTLGGGSPPSAQNPSGGGGGAGGGAMAPQFQTIGTSGVNQLATLQQQPTKAYVVSGEVTSAQSLDRNRVQNATL
jgi:hypothetical protein